MGFGGRGRRVFLVYLLGEDVSGQSGIEEGRRQRWKVLEHVTELVCRALLDKQNTFVNITGQ